MSVNLSEQPGVCNLLLVQMFGLCMSSHLWALSVFCLWNLLPHVLIQMDLKNQTGQKDTLQDYLSL